jgi:hypothetical protein
MRFRIARQANRQRSPVVERAAQLLGIFLDDREAGIDLSKTLVTERVGPGQVGSYIAVGNGEVGQDGLGETGVALVGELEGLCSVGIALVVGDGV